MGEEMAEAHELRCTRVYHTIVAVVTLLAGGGLLGLGIWLQTSGQHGLLDLNFSDTNVLDIVLRANIAAIAFGIFFILTAIVSLVALSRNCIGITFRIIYVILAAIILAVLVLICVASITLLRNRDNEVFENKLKDAWALTVDSGSTVTCELEEWFQCRGFEDSDCTQCITGLEASCTPVAKAFCAPCGAPKAHYSVGCFDKIVTSISRALLPAAIVSGVLAAMLLMDMMVMCCL